MKGETERLRNMKTIFIPLICAGFLWSFPVTADQPELDYPLPDETVQEPSVKSTVSDYIADDSKRDIYDGYTLAPGNRVKIKVYPEDDYIKGGDMEVSSDGNITLPLVGKVEVAGMRVSDAERKLAEIIDKDYIVNPEVVIEVTEETELTVMFLGAVKQPGPIPFPKGKTRFTLLQALSEVGGFSDVANIKKIKIVREGSGQKEVMRANVESIISGKDPDIELAGGDIIHVAESLF